MRRRGVLMAEAAGMANALTLPLAATATLTWLLMAWLSPVALPNGFVGNIWLSAAAQLVVGSWLGLKIASRWLARLPDRWHVRIYPLLLIAAAGDERVGIMRDAALRIHPRVARVILLSFFLRILARHRGR
jgi:uncharacterized membrane protein YfcA